MRLTFGIHTNAQNKPLSDLIEVWRHADRLGYGWISISDHFPGSLGGQSNEAVATQTVMAGVTERAVCGVLAYSVGFRHPAVLASAVTTIDHVSNGRAAIGLGAGSAVGDYETYGFEMPSIGVRMNMLEEAVQCVARFLHDDEVNFAGAHYRFTQAKNAPRPVQRRLPVIVGTKGERRGLRIVAAHADGWNCTFPTAAEFAHKRGVLADHCAAIGRAVDEVHCSVNLVLALGQNAASQPNGVPAAAALTGTVDDVVAQLERYADAGAQQVNFFLSHPWDLDGLTSLAERLELQRA